MKKISVVGFGKIGQAVVANILDHDIHVSAVDINPDLKRIFESGQYVSNEPGLSDSLNKSFGKGLLQITDDFSAVQGSQAIIVAIPLLVDKQKNILDEPFLDCFKKLAPFLSDNVLIVIETSIPVGYGRNTVVPAIESMGKKHGTDFLLVHSPERIKSGSMLKQLLVTPKVIGGVSKEATEKAYEIYQWFFNRDLIHIVDSIEAAEMVKLAGMAYRDVNIALSNQLAQFAQRINVNFADLIPLINTDGEAYLLQPGIGVGGHCTPVYPYFLINNFRNAGMDFVLASESRVINDEMAKHAVSLISNRVNHKKALILGLSFRPNIKEDTFSTTYLLRDALIQDGFEVMLHDTEFSMDDIKRKGFNPVADIYSSGAEAVFVVTIHEQYKNIDYSKLASSGVRFLLDGRNGLDKVAAEAAGISYTGIGR
ncbi:MAG: nucleotide sugar dehydrogenase [Flavobacteriales bacterium]|nr:nucleotide sugar dehydrogenase [Flavobacteriales bacterium]